MTVAHDAFRTDAAPLLDTLAAAHDLLLIQDLDGVCMELVRDPLDRCIARDYVEAAAALGPRFYVLTNGEHSGRRGVNALVDRLFAEPGQARRQGAYLPGLAAGG
ncbi:glucosylglycerolphosphate phosphatase, partial [Xanthomonas sp. Kuri4-1]